MLEIKSKDVKGIIQATFPEYRKRKVYIKPVEKVKFNDVNWSEGGSISIYKACTIDWKPLNEKIDMGIPAPWNNPFEGLEIPLPINNVIVEGGFFCGQERILYLYINPANMPKLITEGGLKWK